MMINEQIAEGMFITKTRISKKTLQFGKDILDSEGMNYEKSLKHHGRISCFEHSVNVAEESLKIVGFFSLKVNEKALIRGALLHDYFLYDWRLGTDCTDFSMPAPHLPMQKRNFVWGALKAT